VNQASALLRHGFVRVAIALCLLAGCSQPPNETLLKSVAPAHAWIASMAFALERWTSNAVPTSVTAGSLDAASKEIAKARQRVASTPADPALRNQLARNLSEASVALQAVRSPLEHRDTTSVRRQIAQLHRIDVALSRIEKAHGE
jgi:hypothetical protein